MHATVELSRQLSQNVGQQRHLRQLANLPVRPQACRRVKTVAGPRHVPPRRIVVSQHYPHHHREPAVKQLLTSPPAPLALPGVPERHQPRNQQRNKSLQADDFPCRVLFACAVYRNYYGSDYSWLIPM